MKKIRRTFDELVTITEVDARASYDASALRAAANQQGAGDRGMDGEMTIRPVRKSDESALAAFLNEIIAGGETTALEEPFTPAGLGEAMLTGPAAYCCFVAEEAAGDLVGFQSLTRADHLPDGVADFGTFVRVAHVQKGTGARLFAATRRAAEERDLTAINATIRADNIGGLVFYGRLGFEDDGVHNAVPLRDGTPVDRISKRDHLQRDR